MIFSYTLFAVFKTFTQRLSFFSAPTLLSLHPSWRPLHSFVSESRTLVVRSRDGNFHREKKHRDEDRQRLVCASPSFLKCSPEVEVGPHASSLRKKWHGVLGDPSWPAPTLVAFSSKPSALSHLRSALSSALFLELASSFLFPSIGTTPGVPIIIRYTKLLLFDVTL